jgi:short-subunit dehydrogenase
MRILITGATAGIGKQAALDLLARGHEVFVTGRRRDALDAVRAEAARRFPDARCHVLVLDVTSASSVAAAVAETEAVAGGIDVLVNNAGYATVGPMIELDHEALEAQFETNVFGLMHVTRAFGAKMIERRAGRIINIGSVSGRIPAPMLGAYHATKYALEAITDALRMELRLFGIGVTIIEPGTIRTDFASRAMSEASDARASATRYAEVYARQAELAARFDRIASGPAVVSRAIVHAAEAKRAPIRLVAPRRFLLMIAVVKVLPTAWGDYAMRKIAGLDRLSASRATAPQHRAASLSA